ncbi:MAG: glycosyltransferase family 87 protein [Propionicimonas sp.]
MADGSASANVGRPVSRRPWMVLAWVGVAAAASALVLWRFQLVVNVGAGADLGYFLGAAERIRAGLDPYGEPMYVYSPLVASILSTFPDRSSALAGWTALSLCAIVTAVAATVATFWRRLTPWQRPVLAGVAVVSALMDGVTGLDLTLGQSDPFVLAALSMAVFFATRSQHRLVGVALALGALIKTWPVTLGLWVWRTGVRRRGRTLLWAAITCLVFVLAAAAAFGPGSMRNWFLRTVASSSQPYLVWSVWGPGRHLLSRSGNLIPLTESPHLALVLGTALAIAVLVLLLLVLYRPGDDALSMWNLTFAVILLLPVSHQQYHLLVLPLVWVWTALVLSDRRKSGALMALVGVGGWRLVEATITLVHVDSRWHYLGIMVVTLAAFAVSVLCAAARDHQMDSQRPVVDRTRAGVGDHRRQAIRLRCMRRSAGNAPPTLVRSTPTAKFGDRHRPHRSPLKEIQLHDD